MATQTPVAKPALKAGHIVFAEKIKQTSRIRGFIFRVQEKLLNTCVPERDLRTCAHALRPVDYMNVMEERNLEDLCGYPPCTKPNLTPIESTKKYRISTKDKKVYDVTSGVRFCSEECMLASHKFKASLSEEPPVLKRMLEEGENATAKLVHPVVRAEDAPKPDVEESPESSSQASPPPEVRSASSSQTVPADPVQLLQKKPLKSCLKRAELKPHTHTTSSSIASPAKRTRTNETTSCPSPHSSSSVGRSPSASSSSTSAQTPSDDKLCVKCGCDFDGKTVQGDECPRCLHERLERRESAKKQTKPEGGQKDACATEADWQERGEQEVVEEEVLPNCCAVSQQDEESDSDYSELDDDDLVDMLAPMTEQFRQELEASLSPYARLSMLCSSWVTGHENRVNSYVHPAPSNTTALALTQQEDTDNNKTDGEGEKDEDDDGWEGEKPVVLAPMPAELVYTRQQVLSTTLDRYVPNVCRSLGIPSHVPEREMATLVNTLSLHSAIPSLPPQQWCLVTLVLLKILSHKHHDFQFPGDTDKRLVTFLERIAFDIHQLNALVCIMLDR